MNLTLLYLNKTLNIKKIHWCWYIHVVSYLVCSLNKTLNIKKIHWCWYIHVIIYLVCSLNKTLNIKKNSLVLIHSCNNLLGLQSLLLDQIPAFFVARDSHDSHWVTKAFLMFLKMSVNEVEVADLAFCMKIVGKQKIWKHNSFLCPK